MSDIDKVVACKIVRMTQTRDADASTDPFDMAAPFEIFDWRHAETLDQNSTRLMTKIVETEASAVLLTGNNHDQHILLLALGLLRTGIDVWVCIDAVQSETEFEHVALISRLQHSGAICLTRSQLKAERESMPHLLKALDLSTNDAGDHEEPIT